MGKFIGSILLQRLKSRLALGFGAGLIMGLVLMVLMKRLRFSRHPPNTDPATEASLDDTKLQITDIYSRIDALEHVHNNTLRPQVIQSSRPKLHFSWFKIAGAIASALGMGLILFFWLLGKLVFNSRFFLDHHIVAGVTIFGMICDILGGLYLAYDLLGGSRGPLRRLTEIITVGIVCLCTGLLGSAFIIVAAMKFNLRMLTVVGFLGTTGMALGFGGGGGLGLALGYGLELALPPRDTKTYWSRLQAFGVRGAWALVISFTLGLLTSLGGVLGPTLIHSFKDGLGLGLAMGLTGGTITGFITGRKLIQTPALVDMTIEPAFDRAGPILGLIITIPGGLIISTTYWFIYGPYNPASLLLALLIGVLVSVIGGLGGGSGIGIAKRVNWWVGKLAPTRMGTFGAFLIMGGFLLQLFQYVVNLFDIPVR